MKKYLLLSLLLLVVACGKNKVEDTKTEKEKVTSEKEFVVVEKEIQISKEEKEIKEEKVILEEEKVAVEEEKLIEKAPYLVSRSRLTSEVQNKEPRQEKKEYGLNERAFFFTEVKEIGANARKISHKWYHVDDMGNEKLNATVKLEVRGNRWRTWSSKQLNHSGQWIVRVEDHLGNVMVEDKLMVR